MMHMLDDIQYMEEMMAIADYKVPTMAEATKKHTSKLLLMEKVQHLYDTAGLASEDWDEFEIVMQEILIYLRTEN